ncbi:MAG: DUF302 domain-containing protein [Alphaproteobacteria bacterium]|nr:DUF302 domain-containing protein [Alphaproteobacteria bacterium]
MSNMKSKYGFGKTVFYSFDVAIEKVKKELEKEGFGTITEIDVAAILKKKLNHEMPPYLILGACNPQFAHRALEIDSSIGLLLPCNVVLRVDGNNKVDVEIMDPNAVLNLVGQLEIDILAREVRKRLERVLKAL